MISVYFRKCMEMLYLIYFLYHHIHKEKIHSLRNESVYMYKIFLE